MSTDRAWRGRDRPPRSAQIQPGTIAVLIARGCADEHLADAYDWLARQFPAPTVDGCIAQIDEAIAVASAM